MKLSVKSGSEAEGGVLLYGQKATTKVLLAKMSLGCSQKAGKLSSCGWLLERNYPVCGEQTEGTLVGMSRTWGGTGRNKRLSSEQFILQ